jgi:hypothetical protein
VARSERTQFFMRRLKRQEQNRRYYINRLYMYMGICTCISRRVLTVVRFACLNERGLIVIINYRTRAIIFAYTVTMDLQAV